MKVAEILSDLNSLRVCDYNDALNLVTVNEKLPQLDPVHEREDPDKVLPQDAKEKNDIRLAAELIELHHEIKAVHRDGRIDEKLRRGREAVNRVLQELAGSESLDATTL